MMPFFQGVCLTQYNIVSQCLVRSIDGEYYMRAFGNFQVIGYVCVLCMCKLSFDGLGFI